jgi:hypothetical protein
MSGTVTVKRFQIYPGTVSGTEVESTIKQCTFGVDGAYMKTTEMAEVYQGLSYPMPKVMTIWFSIAVAPQTFITSISIGVDEQGLVGVVRRDQGVWVPAAWMCRDPAFHS